MFARVIENTFSCTHFCVGGNGVFLPFLMAKSSRKAFVCKCKGNDDALFAEIAAFLSVKGT